MWDKGARDRVRSLLGRAISAGSAHIITNSVNGT